jgi:hypothetical protein
MYLAASVTVSSRRGAYLLQLQLRAHAKISAQDQTAQGPNQTDGVSFARESISRTMGHEHLVCMSVSCFLPPLAVSPTFQQPKMSMSRDFLQNCAVRELFGPDPDQKDISVAREMHFRRRPPHLKCFPDRRRRPCRARNTYMLS